ncbi:hypothetical protein V8C34DRAFT_290759 [Trichoderma compactum]
MSGAEIIGLISSIIAIVDASLKIYEAVGDSSGLPSQFRDAAARLPVIQNTLENVRTFLTEEEEDGEGLWTSKSHEALSTVLQSCFAKTTSLNRTLQAVMPKEGTSSMRRYIKALKTLPNADKVECLMNGILRDVQVLAANHTVKSATRLQVRSLSDMMKKAEKRESMNGSRRATVSFYNSGLGAQCAYDGQGNQNVLTGQGLQINGVSTAPFHITLAR